VGAEEILVAENLHNTMSYLVAVVNTKILNGDRSDGVYGGAKTKEVKSMIHISQILTVGKKKETF